MRRTFAETIEVDPEELAILFCDMDSNEMVDFFNHIPNEIKKRTSSIVMKLKRASRSSKLTDEGRRIMRYIGDYGKGN